MSCGSSAVMTRTVLEFVQLFMARVPAPSSDTAGLAAVDLMRCSLVCRTDHTQLCQLRAVTWRLRAEQVMVRELDRTLDQAADSILDLQDLRDELYLEIDNLVESLQAIRAEHGITFPVISHGVRIVT